MRKNIAQRLKAVRVINKGHDASQAQQYLRMAGGEVRPNYNPTIAQNDDRGFVQRALFSPERRQSPRPYAIWPVTLDEPNKMPALSHAGLLSSAFGGLRGDQDEPRVSTRSEPATGKIEGGSGQRETGPENFSNVEMAEFDEELSDAEIGALAMSALNAVPDAPALQSTPSMLSDPTGEQRLPVADPARILVDDSNIPTYFPNDGLLSPAFGPNDTGYYDRQMMMGVGTDQLFTPQPMGMRLIETGPHAGKYIDASGRLRVL